MGDYYLITLTMKGMTMIMTDKIADYDLNVSTYDRVVYVSFYPLEYSEDGLATVNTSDYYTLEIPGDARGPLYRNALAYLEKLVNKDFEDSPEIYLEPGWSLEDDFDWWNTETCLVDPPKLIADFVDNLPRQSALQRFGKGK